MWARVDREGRDLTASERAQMQDLIDAAKSQHGIEQEIKELGHELGGPLLGSMGVTGSTTFGGGIGDVFVASKGWNEIADPGTRPQTWSTGAVEVPPFQTKAGTLFEGTGGQGAGLVPVPQVIPGIVDKLFEPLGVADVFPSGQTTTSNLRYIVEGTATNAAAGVAEGGTKPASDLAMSTVDEPVKKIATVLTVSDELLEDAATVQTYLNSRLALFVRLEEER